MAGGHPTDRICTLYTGISSESHFMGEKDIISGQFTEANGIKSLLVYVRDGQFVFIGN